MQWLSKFLFVILLVSVQGCGLIDALSSENLEFQSIAGQIGEFNGSPSCSVGDRCECVGDGCICDEYGFIADPGAATAQGFFYCACVAGTDCNCSQSDDQGCPEFEDAVSAFDEEQQLFVGCICLDADECETDENENLCITTDDVYCTGTQCLCEDVNGNFCEESVNKNAAVPN